MEPIEEAIPRPGEEPPKKRGRGRPPGSKTKKEDAPPELTTLEKLAAAKAKVPDEVVVTLGTLPYLVADFAYSTKWVRPGRTLGLPPGPASPVGVQQTFVASLEALRAWLAQGQIEPPAWVVYLMSVGTCIGAAYKADVQKEEEEIAAANRPPEIRAAAQGFNAEKFATPERAPEAPTPVADMPTPVGETLPSFDAQAALS
jgi:hypothetical protein